VRASWAQGADNPLVANDPKVLVLEAIDDLAILVLVRKARFDFAWWFRETVGKHEADRAENHPDHGRGQRGPGDVNPAAKGGNKEKATLFGLRGRFRGYGWFGRRAGLRRGSLLGTRCRGAWRTPYVAWFRHGKSFNSPSLKKEGPARRLAPRGTL